MQTSVYSCDGPTCLRSDDNSMDENGLMEAGWLIVAFIEDEEERIAHLCSCACLETWAAENVS